ncbi:hypothetical protein IMY05_006G0088300 [Salix suchowensis]|nr:hypothetical protein IMY05_006G0088300 [Salix suchowensis]
MRLCDNEKIESENDEKSNDEEMSSPTDANDGTCPNMARRISCPAVHKMMIEEELSVDADGSLAGDQSGDIAGEMD